MGCHPNVRPETAMGVSARPPSLTVCPHVCHLILHSPRRLGPECTAALRVSRVVLATKSRMNPNPADAVRPQKRTLASPHGCAR